MDKGLRLGFNQIVWSRERDFLARAIDLPTGLDDEVFQALGQLDNIADPRTGASSPAVSESSASFTPRKHNKMVTSCMVLWINTQISRLRIVKKAQTDPTRVEMLQRPIEAMENFCDEFRELLVSSSKGESSSQNSLLPMSRKRRLDDEDAESPSGSRPKARDST